MAAKRTGETKSGYVMRAKQCRPCRGTGVGRFERGAPIACIQCLGYGQILYAERTTAAKARL